MLNEAKGNMYEFITHTWNAIKGKCPHECSYCYMTRYGTQRPMYLDQKELRTNFGTGKFIFVGSSTDMFTESVDPVWIEAVLAKCASENNRYLFQTKNPKRFSEFPFPTGSEFCTTIETNRIYPQMAKTPSPEDRALWLAKATGKRYVTIEPIMDFDLDELLAILKLCSPDQMNIGADSGGNSLPEPSKSKILELAAGIAEFSVVAKKINLDRLVP